MRIALALSVVLSAASCAGPDPLSVTDPDAGPLPDGTVGWQAADLAGDPVATFDLRSDLGQPDRRPDLGRDLPPSPLGSGLDRARPVASLSDAELGRLCDWGLSQLGGYGTTLVCTDGTQIRNSPSQQACIAGHDRSFRCIATVGDSEDCLRAIGAGGCSQSLFLSLPACRAMFTCQGA
jgi:hypothetical protein